MDRDDAGMSDRRDEALEDDAGMIGSESEEPGPGRDTSLTDPDPVAASTDQPRGTVAMSEGDPMTTRLGSHIEGAGTIGYDVAAAEEGATQQTPAEDRPGYEPERSAADDLTATAPATAASAPAAYEREPGLAAERVEDVGSVDRSTVTETTGYEGEPRGAGTAGYRDEPGQDVPATYTGEETDVTGRPEYADRVAGGDQPLYQEEPQRGDRPGGGGSLFTDDEPERLDRPGPQEPGVQEGVYDQEADRARRPSEGG
jgi:hypothetical protein